MTGGASAIKRYFANKKSWKEVGEFEGAEENLPRPKAAAGRDR